MTSVLLLAPRPPARPFDGVDAVEPRPVRLRDRIGARVRAHALDRRLAAGVPPERSAALTLRARRLIDPDLAAMLARSLHRILRDAREHHVSRARMPARIAAVRAAAEDLDELARRLVAPAPAAPRGIAQVRLLLTDGRGPLYSGHADEDLAAAVRRARVALEPI